MKWLTFSCGPWVALLLACAPIARKLGDNHYETVCSGQDDMECQEKAWKQCNGPYETKSDNHTGNSLQFVGTGNAVVAYTVKDYKLQFKCVDKEEK